MDIVVTTRAPAAIGPYSQAVVASGFVYVSGQLPVDPSANELIADISSATRQSLRNGLAIVAAASSTARVVKTTVFLRDLNDFAAMNEAYAAFFGDRPPARSTVQVARLPRDAVVEIEMIAAL